MKIVRYINDAGHTYYASIQEDGSYKKINGLPYGNMQQSDEEVFPHKILVPVKPKQILGIGLNYSAHAAEAGMAEPERPVLFAKGINTVCHPLDPIIIPTKQESTKVDYECELAVIIGKDAKNVSVEDALDYVMGYTCANDISARDWQLEWGGGQWNKGKFFDTFAPMGPCMVTPDEIPDPNNLGIRTYLNGEIVQDSNTNDMIFTVAEIISFLSGSTTLPHGTIIFTGTPQGVGMGANPPRYLKEGDVVDIEIDGIGRLSNPVKNEV